MLGRDPEVENHCCEAPEVLPVTPSVVKASTYVCVCERNSGKKGEKK